MKNSMAMISTDCVCDIPKSYQKKYNIQMMYYYVQTEEARFQDIKEISSDSLLEYIKEGKKAYSGAAPKEEYVAFFQSLKEKHKGPIIHICMAQHVSIAYEVASEAALEFKDIHVVDSGHLSGGMAILVLMAADMAQRGASCELIIEELQRVREKVSSSFSVASTAALYRNGRIGKKVFLICNALLLHPILNLHDSKMSPAGICIGKPKHFAKTYLRWALRKKNTINTDIVFLITAGCSYEFQDFLKEEMLRRVPFKKVVINNASGTICCNCGAGAFGVLFVRE